MATARVASMDQRYLPLAGVVTVLLLLAFATWPRSDGGSRFSGLTSSSTARALVDPATVSYGSVDPARGKLLQVQLVFRCAFPRLFRSYWRPWCSATYI